MTELALIGILLVFVLAIRFAQRGDGRADDEPGVYGYTDRGVGGQGGGGG